MADLICHSQTWCNLQSSMEIMEEWNLVFISTWEHIKKISGEKSDNALRSANSYVAIKLLVKSLKT